MKTLLVEQRGGVAYVTLHRPEVRNAFDEILIAELTEVFAHVDARLAVLAGAGKVFCAGADVDWMRRSIDRTEEDNRRDAERMAAMFRAINECTCPVIGRIHGAALGGGVGLASVCDIVLAADDATFAFSEVKLGLLPAVISSFALRKVGESAARRYFLTAEMFSASEAKRIGLVHEVVPPGELDGRISEITSLLLRNGPLAVREAKKLIRTIMPMPWDDALGYATAKIARVRTSPEAQEGLRAFLEKRPAAWLPPLE